MVHGNVGAKGWEGGALGIGEAESLVLGRTIPAGVYKTSSIISSKPRTTVGRWGVTSN